MSLRRANGTESTLKNGSVRYNKKETGRGIRIWGEGSCGKQSRSQAVAPLEVAEDEMDFLPGRRQRMLLDRKIKHAISLRFICFDNLRNMITYQSWLL